MAGIPSERPNRGTGNEVVLFVSSEGSDRWSGRLPEANRSRTDGPLATLAGARGAVKAIRAGKPPAGPTTVMVRGGRYRLAETFVLNAADGGSRDCPVVYAAYRNEKPILSGGRPVTGWKPHGSGALRCGLPDFPRGWKTRQLFCDGRRMPRSRWPKPNPADPLYTGWAFIEGPDEENPTTAFRYKPGTFRRRWAKPGQVEVKIFAGVGWNMKCAPIGRMDERERIIGLAYDQWNFDVSPWYCPIRFQSGNRFCVENALEELNLPGEWCLDSEEGALYFRPPGKPIEECEVTVPVLDCLVDIRDASWITFSGFTLTETLDGDNLHPEGVEGCGAMAVPMGTRYVGSALRLRNAEYCRITDNFFREVGGNAVYLENHNLRNMVSGNEIEGAGANGICLAGTRLRHPMFNRISDNYIHHCGVLNKYVAGVFLGTSDGNFVRHNRIEHLPHHAVNLGDNPDGRNYVEYNKIRWVAEEIADTAAINCWMELGGPGSQRCGHVIRCNYISDIYGVEIIRGKVRHSRDFPASGIYLDNCAGNCLVYGNILVRCSSAGVLIHNGKNNVIENNVFVDCQVGVRLQDPITTQPYWRRMAGFMTGNVVRYNICYQGLPDSYPYGFQGFLDRDCPEDSLACADYNLFFRTGRKDYRLKFYPTALPEGNAAADLVSEKERRSAARPATMKDWQTLGFDLHSRFEDPVFADPQKDDFRLCPGSPARRIGFQTIPIAETGVRKRKHRD